MTRGLTAICGCVAALGLFSFEFAMNSTPLQQIGHSEAGAVYGADAIGGGGDCWVLVGHNCPLPPSGTCETDQSGNCGLVFGPGPDGEMGTADDEPIGWNCNLTGPWKTKEGTTPLTKYYTADDSDSGHHQTDDQEYLCYTQIKCKVGCVLVDRAPPLDDFWACQENGATEEEGEKYAGKIVFDPDCLPDVSPSF